MSLSGKTLLIALVSVALVGVLAGSFASGWRKARGLPAPECVTDAGVKASVDAGFTERQNCAATVEHWTVVHVPGPTVYVTTDAGVTEQPQTVTILVPDVRLGSSQALQSTEQVVAEAQVTSSAKMEPVTKEPHWELGPAVFRTPDHELYVGVGAGWSAGPFGVRAVLLGNGQGVGAGLGVVWRF